MNKKHRYCPSKVIDLLVKEGVIPKDCQKALTFLHVYINVEEGGFIRYTALTTEEVEVPVVIPISWGGALQSILGLPGHLAIHQLEFKVDMTTDPYGGIRLNNIFIKYTPTTLEEE